MLVTLDRMLLLLHLQDHSDLLLIEHGRCTRRRLARRLPSVAIDIEWLERRAMLRLLPRRHRRRSAVKLSLFVFDSRRRSTAMSTLVKFLFFVMLLLLLLLMSRPTRRCRLRRAR